MTSVGLLWRQEWDPPSADKPVREGCRLHGVFAAFAELGVEAEPVIYADDRIDETRDQLLRLDGVLIWVNPIQAGLDRSKLDPLLREVANEGVWVSAHPEVIMRMATKRVLYDTRQMNWGTDTRLYLSADELREGLGARLADGVPRVLKQQRGMGGEGVWKLELDRAEPDLRVRVQHAARKAPAEAMPLSKFVALCNPYFDGGGLMVEQPFQERISEGMIRAYLTHHHVVGFAHQYPAGLRPASAGEPPPGKQFELPDAEQFCNLRNLVEGKWVPQMQQLLDLDTPLLPVIWDIDFLYGPKTEAGEETFVLCEINASSTFAFPEHAMPGVAKAALERIEAHV